MQEENRRSILRTCLPVEDRQRVCLRSPVQSPVFQETSKTETSIQRFKLAGHTKYANQIHVFVGPSDGVRRDISIVSAPAPLSRRPPCQRNPVSSLDFAQSARVHVENETAHGDVFRNPGMRPDFLDLLPGIFLGVLEEKKRIGAGDESPVEALSFAFSSSSVNVVNPQPVWLRSSISLLPSTRFETISSARTSSVTAGPPVRMTSMSARGRPKIPGRSETRGSMQVTTTILGGGGPFPRAGL